MMESASQFKDHSLYKVMLGHHHFAVLFKADAVEVRVYKSGDPVASINGIYKSYQDGYC